MMRLRVRVRFALLTALLVLVVGALVVAAGYVAMRGSLLGQAEAQARDQGHQLAALIEVPGAPPPRNTASNLVDIQDPSLSHYFARAGLLVLVARADGRVVQASRGARVLRASPALRSRCLGTGEAAARQDHPPVAISCRRVGRAGAAQGLLLVGAPPTARLPVHLDDVLLAVVAEAQPLRPEVPIRVRRLDDAVVTGDALRLQQLVLNLLDNALRVSPEDGQIDVALSTDVAGATLAVTDRGPGIPPERASASSTASTALLAGLRPRRAPDWGSPSRARSRGLTAVS